MRSSRLSWDASLNVRSSFIVLLVFWSLVEFFCNFFSSTLVQRFRNTMRMQARDVMGILLLLLVATGTFSLSRSRLVTQLSSFCALWCFVSGYGVLNFVRRRSNSDVLVIGSTWWSWRIKSVFVLETWKLIRMATYIRLVCLFVCLFMFFFSPLGGWWMSCHWWWVV